MLKRVRQLKKNIILKLDSQKKYNVKNYRKTIKLDNQRKIFFINALNSNRKN